MASNNTNSPDRLNRIVEGTSIVGDIVCESNIRIDGTVKGTLKTSGRLLVGPKGNIEGEVICTSADIEGTLTGTINVNELLSLKATAKLQGDIVTGKLSIEPGAVFAGTCNMGGLIKDIKPTSKAVEKEEILEEKFA